MQRTVQIQALSDSCDSLMGATQKPNPCQNSFKKRQKLCGTNEKKKLNIRFPALLSAHVWFDMSVLLHAFLLRRHYGVLLSVPCCEKYFERGI